MGVRVVSVPNRGAFLQQEEKYRNKIIPPQIPTLAVELGVGAGWFGINPQGGRVDVFSLERFGASGPGGQEVVEHLGFTIEALKKRIKKNW